MGWLLDELMVLLEIGLVAVLIMALLSPLESLGWWAGWRQRARYQAAEPAGVTNGDASAARHFVVFLSGIGEASGAWRFPEERRFLDRLRPSLPDAVLIDDIFPYLVTSNALDEEKMFNGVWRLVNRMLRRHPTSPVGFLINLRNRRPWVPCTVRPTGHPGRLQRWRSGRGRRGALSDAPPPSTDHCGLGRRCGLVRPRTDVGGPSLPSVRRARLG